MNGPTASLFDEDWKAFGGNDVGLGAIAAFNAGYDGSQDIQCNVGNGLDPQLFSTASSPAMTHTAFDNTDAVAMPTSTGGGMIPDYTYSMAPPPHAFDGSSGQLFNNSIEHQQDTVMLHQPLHPATYHLRTNLHRRSVSEPPDQHHIPHPFPPRLQQGNMTFTRGGVPLGAPRTVGNRNNGNGRVSKEPMYRQPYSVAARKQPPRQGQERYPMRRTQTQPGRPMVGPTSMPQMGMMQSPMTTALALPPVSAAVGAVVSSRVCTPARSPNTSTIDPQLLGVKKEEGEKEARKATMVSVTVEELKAMIVEAVQQALKGTSRDSREEAHIVVEEPGEDAREDIPDEVTEHTRGDVMIDCFGVDGGEDVVESIERGDSVFNSE